MMELPIKTSLSAPFPPERISWRVGSTTKDKSKGMALAYIDARDVQDRLDEVMGEKWQCRYPHANGKTVCEIGLKINDEWIWRSDGAGDSDIEAEKGALSDAFKRAAVRWGIGRYLYDLDSPWVELETYDKNGQLFVKGIKASEFPKLRALLSKSAPAQTPSAPSQPAEPEALTKAKAWVSRAEVALPTIKTREGMGKWMRENATSLDKVREADRAIYDAINLKIAQRNNFVMELENA